MDSNALNGWIAPLDDVQTAVVWSLTAVAFALTLGTIALLAFAVLSFTSNLTKALSVIRLLRFLGLFIFIMSKILVVP